MHIEDLVVIDRLDVSFGPGFTVLTGETGAGKSLLVQALGLVAGGRAQTELVRSGADAAIVEARLRLADTAALQRLRDEGYGSGEDVLVRRILQRDGNHRIYVNGRMATAQLLQDVVGPELEIHAQHSQQRLLASDVQERLLDAFAGCESEVAEVGRRWRAWQEVVSRMEELATKSAQRDREIDYLRFQVSEFDTLAPREGELEELRARLSAVRAGAVVAQTANAVREWLVEGDGSAVDRVYSAAAALAEAGRHVPALVELGRRVEAVADELRACAREVERAARAGGDSDEDMGAIEARVQQLEKLARRHGGELKAAIVAVERMRRDLAELQDLDAALERLRVESEKLGAHYREAAERLSARRRSAAEKLSKAIVADLRELEMPHARFAVGGWLAGAPGPRGIDRIEFLLSANPGDEPRSLRRVASGGELSRVLLAVQGAVGVETPGATVVFDEVDTGIGGETAMTVGRRMRRLGAVCQVLAVTHTAQVAAHAHRQVHLRKSVIGKRAVTVAEMLGAAERADEIARMLGGRDHGTAVEHARVLLKQAEVA